MSANPLKRILLGGGSGFVGRAITRKLKSAGYGVTVISRKHNPEKTDDEWTTWEEIEEKGLPEAHAVVNLSGENILTRSWSETGTKELIESRTGPAGILTKAIEKRAAQGKSVPKVFLSTSAVGFYKSAAGKKIDENTTETDPGFPGHLCRTVEKAGILPPSLPVRCVAMRVGVVLGPGGGILQGVLPSAMMGCGAVLGTGKQMVPWVHVDDVAGMYLHAIRMNNVTKVMNVVAPESVSYRAMMESIVGHMGRPLFLRVPEFALKLLLQDRAEVILSDLDVKPRVALDSGYEFQFSDIDSAMKDILKRAGYA